MVSFDSHIVNKRCEGIRHGPAKRYARKQAKAIQRRRLNAKERHGRQQRQAQRDIEALH